MHGAPKVVVNQQETHASVLQLVAQQLDQLSHVQLDHGAKSFTDTTLHEVHHTGGAGHCVRVQLRVQGVQFNLGDVLSDGNLDLHAPFSDDHVGRAAHDTAWSFLLPERAASLAQHFALPLVAVFEQVLDENLDTAGD